MSRTIRYWNAIKNMPYFSYRVWNGSQTKLWGCLWGHLRLFCPLKACLKGFLTTDWAQIFCDAQVWVEGVKSLFRFWWNMLQSRNYSEDKRFCLFAIVCSDVWLTDIVNLSAMIAGSDSNLFLVNGIKWTKNHKSLVILWFLTFKMAKMPLKCPQNAFMIFASWKHAKHN